MYTQAFLKLKYLMELKYKKLGQLFVIVYNSKLLNVSKSLRINYNDLRVCCFSWKIRFLSTGTQNCPSIDVVEVLHFLEVGRRGVQYFLSVHATEVCIFLEVEHRVVLSHVRCIRYLQVKTASHSVSC